MVSTLGQPAHGRVTGLQNPVEPGIGRINTQRIGEKVATQAHGYADGACITQPKSADHQDQQQAQGGVHTVRLLNVDGKNNTYVTG